MATVRPFQGIRYDPQRVDLARVVAPPYDVISPRDQLRYYQQDPHNVVRLIAGEVRLSDTPDDNKYTRAAGFFSEWLREGVLRLEPSLSIRPRAWRTPDAASWGSSSFNHLVTACCRMSGPTRAPRPIGSP